MATRPKLVIYKPPYQAESLFHSAWFITAVNNYFQIENWIDQPYPPETVFVVGCNHWINPACRDRFVDRRVIIDALWESRTGKWGGLVNTINSNHVIFYGNANEQAVVGTKLAPSWFWVNESLWFQYREYNHYFPQRNLQKYFLMPIGHWRQWRETVVNELQPWLPNCYWSMVKQGRFLPGTKSPKRLDHRYMNPVWYDDTHFTMVLESARNWNEAVQFLTEKTYKPLAAYHPFMIIGAAGVLNLLKQQGFMTFDNLFDESYDLTNDLDQKIKIIKTNLDRFSWGTFDKETQERVEHNRHRFYDNVHVYERLKHEVIEPMYEFIESR